ncbi:MAG: TrmB family transcriptional regulator [Clostridia bacterium]|nr:TrmB family transcriptional regulator [Clostridia bacterium]
MADRTILVEQLMQFSLTRQEATIYIYLCENEKLTGYEAAKLTGISRSNVYSALAGLVEKGAAYLIDGTTSRYVAVPVEEFCSNKVHRMLELKAELEECMPTVTVQTEGYLTIEGTAHIEDKIRNMIAQSTKRLYISAQREIIQKFFEELKDATARGIKVVILTDYEPDPMNAVVYKAKRQKHQIRLIIDSYFVLTGELEGKASDTCLYSGQKNFVTVFKEALRNEIKLIESGDLYDEN